ncbi:MAG: hypothetical protein DMG56_27275 [Acidobacteria bacterium]|nr:MAG: hypothetical protein DMG56_27275 [Acidobacteriota bacterium]
MERCGGPRVAVGRGTACGSFAGKAWWRERAPEVKALRWQGSGDIAALSRANCFLVVPADREKIDIGETVSVLLRKDLV